MKVMNVLFNALFLLNM